MRGRSLFLRYKRHMEKKDWEQVVKGYSMGVIAGVLAGIALMTIFPLTVTLSDGKEYLGLSFKHYMTLLAIFGLGAVVIDFLGQRTSYVGALSFMNTIHHKLGNKVSKLPLGDFTQATSGNYSRMVTQEMMSLSSAVAVFLYQSFKSIASIITVTISAWIWNFRLGIFMTITGPLFVLILDIARRFIDKGKKLSDPCEEEVASRMVEFAKAQGALRSCHASGRDKPLLEAFDKADTMGVKAMWWQTLGNLISGMTLQLITVIFIFFIILWATQGQLSPLVTIACLGLALRYMKMLDELHNNTVGAEERRQQMNKFDDLFDEKEMAEPERSEKITERGAVELEKVFFSYDKSKPLLKDISFKVEANEMCALVGPSGSGKTTIEYLMSRFYDVDSGTVKVGGVDVKNLKTEDLMKEISIVFQDVYLFNDTLISNVEMGNPKASREEVLRACELAGVSEIAQRLPKGWESNVGEGGTSLSGGERQRISIARALLKKSPIVLLDEATSALDAENEAHIVESMEEIRKNSTLIIVAHKLETIKSADKVVVLSKDGTIEDIGNHEELVKKDGAYKKFWEYRSKTYGWKLV